MRTFLPALGLLALLGCADDTPYGTCSSREPCGGSTSLCLQDTSPSGSVARFCTARCTTPAAAASTEECPANSACGQVNGGDPVCLKICTAVTDCPFANAACLVTSYSMGARVCTVRP